MVVRTLAKIRYTELRTTGVSWPEHGVECTADPCGLTVLQITPSADCDKLRWGWIPGCLV